MRPTVDSWVRAHQFGLTLSYRLVRIDRTLASLSRYTSVQFNMVDWKLIIFSTAIILLCSGSGTAQNGRRLKVLVYSPSVAYSHMAFQGTLGDLLVDAGHEVVSIMKQASSNYAVTTRVGEERSPVITAVISLVKKLNTRGTGMVETGAKRSSHRYFVHSVLDVLA